VLMPSSFAFVVFCATARIARPYLVCVMSQNANTSTTAVTTIGAPKWIPRPHGRLRDDGCIAAAVGALVEDHL